MGKELHEEKHNNLLLPRDVVHPVTLEVSQRHFPARSEEHTCLNARSHFHCWNGSFGGHIFPQCGEDEEPLIDLYPGKRIQVLRSYYLDASWKWQENHWFNLRLPFLWFSLSRSNGWVQNITIQVFSFCFSSELAVDKSHIPRASVN